MEVQLHVFLDVDEWLASRPVNFTAGINYRRVKFV